MTASLAARRRREGEKPPMLVNKDNEGKEQKEKKKTGEGWLKESLLMMAGLVWYSIIGLWKKPSNEDSLKINLSLSKALYTPSHVTIRFKIHIGSEPDFRPNFHFYLRKYLRTLGLAL